MTSVKLSCYLLAVCELVLYLFSLVHLTIRNHPVEETER